jgi:NAD(P)-dependent dehydrogenase (short-subunit alcohol dehydrogenase family)
MNLLGKMVLVTGGASGLGAACVRMAASAGARAVILDLNETAAMAVCDEVQCAQFFRVDVSDGPAVERALNDVEAIHVAINCAGIAPAHRTISKEGPAPLDWFERVIRINLIGTFNVARLAAHVMSRNQPDENGERGVIINTASVAAFDGQIGQTAYAASKGGVAAMTLPMARDLSKLGIRVMTIAPGIFETPMMAGMPDELKASLGAQVPFPSRLGRPSEYAALARHIVENPMLNGEVIRLDGAIRMAPK